MLPRIDHITLPPWFEQETAFLASGLAVEAVAAADP